MCPGQCDIYLHRRWLREAVAAACRMTSCIFQEVRASDTLIITHCIKYVHVQYSINACMCMYSVHAHGYMCLILLYLDYFCVFYRYCIYFHCTAVVNKLIKEIVPNIRVTNDARDLLLNCCTGMTSV